MLMDYRVELDIYNGPLDLLLYLIKRDELDVYDIPIARITDSYMDYLRTLEDLASRQADKEAETEDTTDDSRAPAFSQSLADETPSHAPPAPPRPNQKSK